MSNKGAIKKTIASGNQLKSQTTLKSKTHTVNQNIDQSNEKTLKREKKEVPQMIDLKTTKDKLKTRSVLVDKNILLNKNPSKSKQEKENVLLKAKSNSEVSSNTSSSTKRLLTSRKKTDGNTKLVINDIKKVHVQKSVKEKIESQYNEKRGTSYIYNPENITNKLNRTSKSSSSKQAKDKPTLQNVEKPLPRHSSRERKRSRVLSPSEVKVLHITDDTLETKNSTKNEKEEKKHIEDDPNDKYNYEDDPDSRYNYEDDFEDYESDFEEYCSASQISETSDNSTSIIQLEPIELHSKKKETAINSADIRKGEEEHMLDSGHYELAEAKRRAAIVDMLMANHLKSPPSGSELKQTINQSYREEKQSGNKSLPSSTDEGFEDARSGDFIKSPPMSQINHKNLKNSNQEKVVKEPLKKVLSRGEVLMNMIKLDTVEWSLYESKPISYDEFIQNYGKFNTRQISTQTNEDNLDVETQTDENELENKWTQYPVKCRNKLETIEDVKLFKMEHFGVGGDKSNNISLISTSYDLLSLNEFLNKVGKLMLALLEEREMGGNILQRETHEFPFSEGFIKLSVSSLSFLCGRQVTMLHYSEINNKILMSVHAAVNEAIDPLSKHEYIMNCCIGCVWNINEPSRPTKLFYSQSPITACCFHYTNNNIVFAGLQDGSISLWDLQEEEIHHPKIFDKINELNWIIRNPTYTTAGNWEIGSHLAPIVSIRIISKMEEDEIENLNEKFVSIQICSLDEEGHLIIWSVLRNLNANSNDNGLAQWGKVKLIKSQELSLFVKRNESNNIEKEFIDMNVDNVDSNNLYLATNDINILYTNYMGGKNNIPYYGINEMDSCGNTTCIEVCPFKQSYFFAGCTDGSIRLHALNVEKPILKLKEDNCPAGIKCIQWSKSKPMTIYVLDNYSRIIMWDLSNSDIYPTRTVSTKSWGYVKCMKLSPCHTNRDMLNQYLALGTDTGNVEVHKLKKNFYSKQDDFLQEMKTFLNYVSFL
ncbi:PREDICTED: WD repeat-containing protein 60 [Ceratosolen solmsi marchali]|uniref:WD repeat-containing protein 60 n=1 Tax=Ceratosolen solmsi marchali TaxID=326594 RepID=A0AAJ6YWH5_9HYME|nr:PREDICTED: WD repeat-containing protein 60 [Ceratosolen solmsi marchali]